MKKLLPIIVLATIAYFGYTERGALLPGGPTGTATREVAPEAESVLAAAYQNQTSNIQVQGQGIVIRVLPDDTEGSPHQRFLLRLDSGQTVLVAHNIDLAPRVASLREGDAVLFNGEYEWNEKGGVIHWTHHDPAGRHEAGWLKHNGQTFQ